jgi:hypothetical protein
MRRVCLLAFAACATLPAKPFVSEDVLVETVALDLQSDGKGTVGFLLEVAAREKAQCTVRRVEWHLQLQEHDFAAGLASAYVVIPAADRARVKVEEPVAFGGMAYDGRSRTVPVTLNGAVIAECGRGEERKAFGYRTRVAVRGAPVYDR